MLSCAWECVFSARIHALMYTGVCVDGDRLTEALLQRTEKIVLQQVWNISF